MKSQAYLLKLREHVPLKQGLRLLIAFRIVEIVELREHVPLKQGLRPEAVSRSAQMSRLREHVPLKQGLRPTKNGLLTGSRVSESMFH